MATREGSDAPAKPKFATPQELRRFLLGLRAVREKQKGGIEQEQAIRRYLAKYDIVTLGKLMGRAYVDLLKTPSQKRGNPPKKVHGPPDKPKM